MSRAEDVIARHFRGKPGIGKNFFNRSVIGKIAGAALLVLAGQVPAAAQQVNILCAPVAEWCEAIVAAFQRDTGIKVNMARKSGGEILAQIRAEAQNPRTDIWFGGSVEAHMAAAEEGLLARYASPNMKDLHPWAVRAHEQANGFTVGVSSGIIGLVHNSAVATKKGFAPPKNWNDLLDPKLKGEIQMPNPNSSSTAYTIVAGLVQLMGEDQAFAFLGKMHPNVNSYTRSGSAPQKAVAQGESGVSIGFNFDIPTDKARGFPIDIVFPAEGTSYEVAGMSLIKGSRNEAAAKRFYDWYLTAAAQDISASIGQFHIPAHKGAKPDDRIPDTAKLKLIDYDFKTFGAAAKRREILARWDREIGSRPVGQ
ncbi:MAG: ABC transporter substrate-binding protein [Beijerinckiaceae bacterium]|nr:ABC transporter substrate-binding protein [Beijerinckiaceae bacterium]